MTRNNQLRTEINKVQATQNKNKNTLKIYKQSF